MWPYFLRLTTRLAQESREHRGIIYAHAEAYSVGQCIRRLAGVIETTQPEETKNRVLFL